MAAVRSSLNLSAGCGLIADFCYQWKHLPLFVLLVDWFEWDKTPNTEHETVIRECRIRYGKISRAVTIHSNL